MSVEGQAERIRSARARIADLPSMPVDDIFDAGYRAALVGSEARERERIEACETVLTMVSAARIGAEHGGYHGIVQLMNEIEAALAGVVEAEPALTADDESTVRKIAARHKAKPA